MCATILRTDRYNFPMTIYKATRQMTQRPNELSYVVRGGPSPYDPGLHTCLKCCVAGAATSRSTPLRSVP